MPRKMKVMPAGKVMPTGYDKAFPRTLRKLLADSKTTKKDLAAHLGRSGQAISYYCDGTSSPDWETIVEIAKFFSVSTDYLLGLIDENIPNQTIQSVCEYTGLSAATVEYLHRCPDAFTQSFYRKCFDDLIQEREFRLNEVPKWIFKSAQAFMIARKEDSSSSDDLITASDAEILFMAQAREEIRRAIELTTDALQVEVIQALKKDIDTKSEDFSWQVTNIHEP